MNSKSLPVRKAYRLKEYDYSSAGAYFITVCTHNRKCMLSRVVGAIHESPEWAYDLSVIKLTKYGKIVDGIINKIPERYNVDLINYVIMPNHIHMVILINDLRAIRESPLQTRSLISRIVGYIKMNSSKEIHQIKPDLKIWQRNYFDHVIRDDNDYLAIAEYIQTNPGKWTQDRFYVNNF